MKRLLSKTIILGLVLISMTTGGCTDDWFDINTNPNDPIEINLNPALILPGVLTSTSSSVATGYTFLHKWMGVFVVHSGTAPNAIEESYNINQTFNTGAFTTPYTINYNCYFMQKKAEVLKWTFYSGIAKIIKSYNFARVVDVYNDVPYSETLRGVEFITPKYDKGQAIYEDLIKQIDEGMADISNAIMSDNLNITTADVMFKGDKLKWLKFANTLKLRLLIHQADAKDSRSTYIAAEVAKIKESKFNNAPIGFLLTGTGTDVNPGYAQPQANPFYASYGYTGTGAEAGTTNRANNILVEFLKNSGTNGGLDPRLSLFFRPIVNSSSARYTQGTSPEPTVISPPYTHRGGIYGLSIINAQFPFQTANYLSKVGGLNATAAGSQATPGMLKGWTMNSWIITSIESMFLQAEAIQRGWVIDNAQPTAEVAYKNAVTESFRYLYGVPADGDAAFATWYTTESGNGNKSVSWAAADNKLKLIAFQKYIALVMMDALETWTDLRRLGVNYFTIPLSENGGRSSNMLPIRLLYPSDETNYNTANVPSVGRAQGEQFTAKIWWMP